MRRYIIIISLFVSLSVIAAFLFFVTKEEYFQSLNQQASEQLINVELINYLGSVNELNLSLTGEFTVNQNEISPKTYQLRIEKGVLALYDGPNKLRESKSFSFVPKQYGEQSLIRINNRPYLGTVQFNISGSVIRPVNTLPIEDYLKGVVPHEMPASWTLNALKVQAIAARTYAMSHRNRVINDTINFQVYGGYAWHPNSTRAVVETNGETLRFNNDFALTLYSSSNGGITESNANVWVGQALPYFPIKQDPYDPIHPWTFTLNKQQIDLTSRNFHTPESWWGSVREVDTTITNNIKTWLGRNGYPNNEIKILSVPSVAFYSRSSGGRVNRGDITIQFIARSIPSNEFIRNADGSIKIHEVKFVNTTAERVRAMIGISLVRSYLIDDVVDNGSSFTVSGRGFGHGVGMSQWGAKRMADLGFSYQEILQFYYPGTTLTANVQSTIPIPQPNPKPIAPPQTTVPAPAPQPKQVVTEIVLQINSKRATVNGKATQMLEAPFIVNDRTLVPLRFVSEQLGADVHWNEATRVITIKDQNNTLLLRDNNRTVNVNGKDIRIDVAPAIVRSTTFVPLRFVTEQLNGTVVWNPTDRSIRITRTTTR